MKKKCGAKKRDGTPCTQWGMENGRCRMHGGMTPKGIASANFKHGRYSKHLPKGLQQLAAEAVADPDLYNLTELVGVYQARIQTALGELESGGGWERLKALQDAWEEFKIARQDKNSGAYFQAEAKIESLMRAAGHDFWLWKDIDVAAKNMKLLMESERKRRVEAAALIPTVKATDFARAIVLAVRAEVTDPGILQRVQARVTEIIGGYPQVAKDDE